MMHPERTLKDSKQENYSFLFIMSPKLTEAANIMLSHILLPKLNPRLNGYSFLSELCHINTENCINLIPRACVLYDL